jgi:hypothetical protein
LSTFSWLLHVPLKKHLVSLLKRYPAPS